MKETDQTNEAKKMLIDSNLRLQEISQKLLMVKQELEKKNQELEAARCSEKQQKEQLEHELNDLKDLIYVGAKSFKTVPEKKLTKKVAEDLFVKYIQLLRTYLKTKQLDKGGALVEELCQRFLVYGVTPKGIIDLHLKATAQVETIDDLETKRIIFEVRLVLLAVMTKYASILSKKVISKEKG